MIDMILKIIYFFLGEKTVSYLKRIAKELIKTLNKDESFISSKRIERLIAFNCVISICVCFSAYNLYKDKLTITDVSIICGILLTFCGFNTMVDAKEKLTKQE